MKLTITGYSTALFSTWYFIDELALLFDCGDGVTAGLMQKARKVSNVFVSHADRDHLTGLLQFNQLNARPGAPVIHYPSDSGSFPALAQFAAKFDPHIAGTVWVPVKAGDHVHVKDDYYIECFRNNHVNAAPGINKSLSYIVYQLKTKLKPAYAGLQGKEVKELIDKVGKEQLTEQLRTNILAFSGDTPVHDIERWNNCKVLIHEATFLDTEEQGKNNRERNLHSNLEEVIEMAAQLKIEKLILGHFSSRYHPEHIDGRIKELCTKYNIKIPVFRILPGEVGRDVLSGSPVY
jgi:ribonuclease Z